VPSAQAAFWAVLARWQDRPFGLRVTGEPSTVPVPGDELIAVVDALAATCSATPGWRRLCDRPGTQRPGGRRRGRRAPGIADPEAAIARGGSAARASNASAV
jgi:hypothetical protein